MVLVVKNPPANAGDIKEWIQSLGQEDPVEEGTKLEYGQWFQIRTQGEMFSSVINKWEFKWRMGMLCI